jgi:aryl-alcohol dehydrogenase-like predicted oxidoreductase
MGYNRISEKMVLGTVQFGMDYGITNLGSKPAKHEVLKTLSFAWENGIHRFDTAPSYGSEKVLGEFIASNGLQDKVTMLSKIPSLQGAPDYDDRMKFSIDKSLNLLGCPIEVMYLHDAADSALLLTEPIVFQKILDDFPISYFGVSVYEPAEIEKLKECEIDLAFQFPYNVVDKRFNGITVPHGKRYARSIFLQGLLATESALRSGAPQEVSNIQYKYHAALARHGLNPVQHALSFVANSDAIDYFLVGVDSEAHIRDLLNLASNESPEIDILSEIIHEIDVRWLDPRKWK